MPDAGGSRACQFGGRLKPGNLRGVTAIGENAGTRAEVTPFIWNVHGFEEQRRAWGDGNVPIPPLPLGALGRVAFKNAHDPSTTDDEVAPACACARSGFIFHTMHGCDPLAVPTAREPAGARLDRARWMCTPPDKNLVLSDKK
eukprot:CAMPEP_0174835202 /NCGR_PEP_ID=MMETSP1114-20130205/5287_1 /TAXON_ID=312471 /ORGANISM="Neobodo designis, Strain CCAP 1951/1" /LENGTH=142 /DNA_ID=CAMNT_0016069147 /DNA_START=46 /DNA_END=472 /DNA_ORIENTATION=+